MFILVMDKLELSWFTRCLGTRHTLIKQNMYLLAQNFKLLNKNEKWSKLLKETEDIILINPFL